MKELKTRAAKIGANGILLTCGVADILITATDNLNGFTDTIRNMFPESRTQSRMVPRHITRVGT